MPEFGPLLGAMGALFAGGAAASGWTVAVIVANAAFDGLDPGRADRQLRRVMSAAASFQAILLAIAFGCALLAGAMAGAIVAGVTALGFFSNIWTLSPRREKTPPGVRKRTKTQRIIAVSLTLMFTCTALTAAVLSAFGI